MPSLLLLIAAIEHEIWRRVKPWLFVAATALAASALGLLAFLLYTAQHGHNALTYGVR